MEFRDSPDESAFRTRVRSFLADEFPPEFANRRTEWGLFNGAGRVDADFRDFYRTWTTKLNTHGWGAPHWPKEYGGGGLGIREQFILSEEFAWRRAPRQGGIGHGWAGPTIMVYGTPEQKERLLPRILSGEDQWCQLFSEPGAGSDLASLQTRAIRDGDDYVVNGQKIWTSGAHVSHMGILIARTDPDAPKHRGISYFIVDMKTPGINARPLYNMMGTDHFAEVFFDDARIPADCRIGEENRGWYISTTTLDQERSSINRIVMTRTTLGGLIGYLRETPHLKTRAELRHELAERHMEFEIGRWLCYRVAEMQSQGKVPNYEASISKVFGTELQRQMGITGMRVLGMPGQIEPPSRWAPLKGRVERWALAAPSYTIAGGTSEVNRNIIATRGLGLPRA